MEIQNLKKVIFRNIFSKQLLITSSNQYLTFYTGKLFSHLDKVTYA